MASLIVNNVLSSSVEITYDYQGTIELFGYTVKGNYQVDISDLKFEQNDTTLLSGRDAIKEAYGRPNLVARIGADDYLNGQIQSYNFEGGTLVGAETVSISIIEKRRLDDYSSSEFAKYIPNPHALTSFSETYDFSRTGGDYTSTRKVSIGYAQEAGDQFLNNAKTFLTNYYFANRPSLGYQEDGISEKAKIDENFRGNISETYDLINLNVSLTETVTTSIVDPNKNVGRKETQDIKITPQGFLEKIVNIQLTSLRQDSENTLTKALGEIVDEVKSNEEQEFGSPFSISKGITKDGINATLTIQFSTDPNKSQDNNLSYTGTQKKAGKFKEYNLSMMYKSLGKNKIDKFYNCRDFWKSGQDLNHLRVRRLFHPLEEFHEKSRSTSFSKTEGTIQDSIVFTTDPAYKTNDDGLLKFKLTMNKQLQIDRVEKILDLGNLEEQVITSDLKTLGTASVTAEATVSQSMGIYKAADILETKTQEMTDLVDEGVTHITADKVSVKLGEGKSSRNINFLYINE